MASAKLRLPVGQAIFLSTLAMWMVMSGEAAVLRIKRGTLVDISHSQTLSLSSTLKPRATKQTIVSSFASASGYPLFSLSAFPSTFQFLSSSPVLNNPRGSYVAQINPVYDQLSTNDVAATAALQKRLYFTSLPHKEMVLRHEMVRESNGLGRHLLESIRPFHPFYVSY